MLWAEHVEAFNLTLSVFSYETVLDTYLAQ
jgi:hypothetical protein